MPLTRRRFLAALGGSAAGAVVFQACGAPAAEFLLESPLEMPEDLVTGLDNWYATLCRQCATPEGIVVRVVEGRAKKVEGNPDYPINGGKHSARCEAGLQALYHPDRVTGPLVRTGERGKGEWEAITWDDGLARLSAALAGLRQAGGQRGAVLLTDPVGAHLSLVVQRFAAAIGGRHLAYEPLERTNLRAAVKRVFQQDRLPDLDLANAGYVLSFGADFLNTWLSPVRYSRAYGQFRQGDRDRGTLVHADSRFSMTAANADVWLHVRPGMEGLLARSIAAVIIEGGLGDAAAGRALSGGDPEGFARAYAPDGPAGAGTVAEAVGVPAARIREVARGFATHRPSLAFGGGSAGAHTNGLANLEAVYALNYLVGSVGRRGGVVFNPAPPLDDLPASPQASSFSDLRALAAEMSAGDVGLLMVRGVDPVHGLPSAAGFDAALRNVPLIVSFASHMDDTASMADLVLPEHVYLEDWGSDAPDPGPGYQLLGFQQPVVRPFIGSNGGAAGTLGFADALLATARALELDLGLPASTFREVLEGAAAQLLATGRGTVGPARVADYGDPRSLWNALLRHGFWRDETATATGPAPVPQALAAHVAPSESGPTGTGTFTLVPFASASLTDGRGAHLPWLQATPDPIVTAAWRTWVEINVRVAEKLGIAQGDVVRVASDQGELTALAYPHPGIPPEVVAIPIGQGHRAGGRYARGRGANVLSILAPSTDSATGALAWATTRVRIEKTGAWERLPTFENIKPQRAEDDEGVIVQVTERDS